MVRTPDKRGFGTMLIDRSLGGVGGSAQTRFEPSGLLCSIQLPLVSQDVPAQHEQQVVA